MSSPLSEAVSTADEARRTYESHCLLVWRELESDRPELASIIRRLGWDDSTAAKWVCSPGPDGVTPAALVAAGRGDEVEATVRRAQEGLF